MDEILIFWLFVFRILKFLVDDPIPVKTVSNKIESCENETFAPESTRNLSFLQEKKFKMSSTITG
jgi:hypothetical protein